MGEWTTTEKKNIIIADRIKKLLMKNLLGQNVPK